MSIDNQNHDDVIRWKYLTRYWPFVRGIHLSPANSPHKGHWHGVLMSPLICAWINDWLNTLEAGDFRRHLAHYDVTVMTSVYHRASWYQNKMNARRTYKHIQYAGWHKVFPRQTTLSTVNHSPQQMVGLGSFVVDLTEIRLFNIRSPVSMIYEKTKPA